MAWRSSSLSCVACCSSCVDTHTRTEPVAPLGMLCHRQCCTTPHPTLAGSQGLDSPPHAASLGSRVAPSPPALGVKEVFFFHYKRFLPTVYPIAESPA